MLKAYLRISLAMASLFSACNGKQSNLRTSATDVSNDVSGERNSNEQNGSAEPISTSIKGSRLIMPGAALYAAHCESCHGSLMTSKKYGRSRDQISAAMATIPVMNNLKLSSFQITTIAFALSGATDNDAPAPPSTPSVEGVTTSQVKIKWIDAVNTPQKDLLGYRIYRDGIWIADQDPSNLVYTDVDLKLETTYLYQVRAIDLAGNESGNASVTATTLGLSDPVAPPLDIKAPTAPALTTATPSSSSIVVNWTSATDEAGGSGLAAYRLYIGGTLVATVNIPFLSFRVTNLNPLTEYSIQVDAIDKAGNISMKSATQKVSTIAISGSELYGNFCQSCHNAIDQSTKRNRSAANIGNAINDVVSMGSLKFLSAAEIAAISSALSPPVPTLGLARTVPMGTRLYVASVMNEVFSNTETSTTVNTLVTNLITNQVSSFGGNCSIYDGASCPNAVSVPVHEANLAAIMNSPASPVRSGYVGRFCEQALSDSTLVTAMLTNAGLTSASTASSANIDRVYDLFARTKTLNATAIAALGSIYSKVTTSGGSVLDGWKYTALPMCQSIESSAF